jgi:hypothetical protein
MGNFSHEPDESEPMSASTPHPPVTNDLVVAALTRWATEKTASTFYDVLRQCSQGELLFDITQSHFELADGRIGQGGTIALGTHEYNGKNYLLIYSSNEEISRRYANQPYRSLVQNAIDALSLASRPPYDGAILNAAAGDGSCIIEATEIGRGLPENGVNTDLKEAVSRQDTGAALVACESNPLVYIPSITHVDEAGTVTEISVPTALAPDGTHYAMLFTSPAEAWAKDSRYEARPTGISNVLRVLRDSPEQAGIVINPSGPALAFSRDELAQQIGALPD